MRAMHGSRASGHATDYMPILDPTAVSTPEQHAEGAEHGASSVDSLIRETLREYDGRDTIAFVGDVGAGKTVVAALVKHTLSTRWVPRSRGKWEAQTVSGHDEINETIRRMRRGLFPPPTMKNDYPSLKINIHRMKGMPATLEMVLRDMPGEDCSGHLSEPADDDDDIDGQVAEMLSSNGAHLVHATKYVLMIDCEGIGDWDTDKPKAVNAIKMIRKIKARIDRIDSTNRFTDPLAIVFTKADALPEQDAQKSAKDLASKYPDLMSCLRVSHSGPRSFFKVFAKTTEERPEDDEKYEDGDGEECEDGDGEECEDGEESEDDAEEAEDDDAEVAEDDDAEVAEDNEPVDPGDYLVVPLEYSIEEYERLITWLVSPRRDL